MNLEIILIVAFVILTFIVIQVVKLRKPDSLESGNDTSGDNQGEDMIDEGFKVVNGYHEPVSMKETESI